MTVVAYRGHEGGKEEADSVDHLGKSLSQEKYRIETIESDPENSRSPVMTVFRRVAK
jgi:hypothetical protein